MISWSWWFSFRRSLPLPQPALSDALPHHLVVSVILLWASATEASTHCSLTFIGLWGEEERSPPNPG